MPQQVVIFGATSAVAGEVARLFAQDGAQLHLVARSAKKLAALVPTLTGASQITTELADFSQTDGLQTLVNSVVARLGSIDVAFVAHGDLPDQLATEASWDAALATIQVNFLSAVALLIPLGNHMARQGHGALGVITSVAGQRGRPRNYTYGAAKGALTIYLQGLRSRLYGSKVRVITILLGPVDTPMTVDHEKNWTFSTKESVAKQIHHALLRKNGDVYVPGFFRWIIWLVRAVPEWFFQSVPSVSGR